MLTRRKEGMQAAHAMQRVERMRLHERVRLQLSLCNRQRALAQLPTARVARAMASSLRVGHESLHFSHALQHLVGRAATQGRFAQSGEDGRLHGSCLRARGCTNGAAGGERRRRESGQG
jgi:hypothetical protein